jgi:TonB family protein
MGYLGPSLRREKRRERPLRRFAAALVASLAANVLILWALAAAGAFRLGQPAASAPVALAPLSSSQWDANRAIAGAPPPPAPAPQAQPQPPRRDESPGGKVVELSPQQRPSDRPPPNAKYLSDRNTTVEKETVSKYAGNYPRLAPRPEAGTEGKPPAPAPTPPGRRGEAGGKDAGTPGREGAPGQRLTLRHGGELPARQPGEGGEGGRPGAQGADLTVSHEALQRIAGGPNMDGVGDNLPVGEETWLQAREFKYATYMFQLRDAIGRQWFPRVNDAAKDRDPEGKSVLYRERTVVLALVLDPSGNLKDCSVVQSSNVPFLDRVAMSSVEAAQPFPNPPAGMFNAEPTVRIPFAFTVYPGDRHGGIFWRVP